MSMRDLIPWRSGGVQPGWPLQKSLDRVFENIFSDFVPGMFEGRTFSPRINLSETDKEVVVEAECPGMTQNDVEVQLTAGGVILRGERKEDRSETDEKTGRRYVEQVYGSFERMVPLDAEIDEDKVEASFKNGILKIVLPKTEETIKKARKVPIKGEASPSGAKSASSEAKQGAKH